MAQLFVPQERVPGERRVAATPDTVARYRNAGLEVTVEAGAGVGARIDDDAYREAGATITDDADAAWARSDLVVMVGPPDPDHWGDIASHVPQGAVLLGLLAPHKQLDVVRGIASRGASAMAMELVPRISRAQSMDALSSQANLAGYRAALLAANLAEHPFPLFMTAAGTIRPATVLVLGTGVAGLQAIATAQRLGARVRAHDIRAVAREEVESLGADFIDLGLEAKGEGEGGYARAVGRDVLDVQREALAEHCAVSEAVISTAFVPGRPAPVLITREMVERMRPGSVVLDLAVTEGGNCEVSVAGETVEHAGVRVVGPLHLPSQVPSEASAMYARNVFEAVSTLLDDEGEPRIDRSDEVIGPMLLVDQGEVVHREIAERLAAESTQR